MSDFINNTGMLDVGDGHQLYFEDWGNPTAKMPILYLHGGPGGGFGDRDTLIFDPESQRVIFHDQRGAGRSTPFAATDHNTTQDLVEDINKLMKHLKIKRAVLVGNSWGSTLALAYAIAQPLQVAALVVGGIFLGRREDMDYFNNMSRHHFPEVWERFMKLVPEDQRDRPEKYYNQQMAGEGKRAAKHVYEWALYESSLIHLDSNPAAVDLALKKDERDPKALALLETHYFINNNFLPDNYILKNAKKLKDIPTFITHGRYDLVCPPSAAYELHRAIPGSELVFTVAGHSKSDPMILLSFQQFVRRALASV